jgi:hypothetical protein
VFNIAQSVHFIYRVRIPDVADSLEPDSTQLNQAPSPKRANRPHTGEKRVSADVNWFTYRKPATAVSVGLMYQVSSAAVVGLY